MKLSVEIQYMRKANWSLLRAGLPLVWKLVIHNTGDAATPLGLKLRIWLPSQRQPALPPLLDSGEIPIDDPIASGESRDLTPRLRTDHRVEADFEQAVRLSYPREAFFRVELAGVTAECPLTLLMPDEWHLGVLYKGWLVADASVEVAEATIIMPPGGRISVSVTPGVWSGSPPLQAATWALVLREHPVMKGLVAQTVEKLRGVPKNSNVDLVKGASINYFPIVGV